MIWILGILGLAVLGILIAVDEILAYLAIVVLMLALCIALITGVDPGVVIQSSRP